MGHSDNLGGTVWPNRELSRSALARARLPGRAQVVDEQMFTLRFHGESYPVASNVPTVAASRNAG